MKCATRVVDTNDLRSFSLKTVKPRMTSAPMSKEVLEEDATFPSTVRSCCGPCARRSLSRATNWITGTCPRTRLHASSPVVSHTCIPCVSACCCLALLPRLDFPAWPPAPLFRVSFLTKCHQKCVSLRTISDLTHSIGRWSCMGLFWRPLRRIFYVLSRILP